MCSVESVFHSLVSEENIYLFGVFLINDVSHYLGKIDIGLGQFMPSYAAEDVEAVQQSIISTYGNVRGKDFARKRNLRHGSSQTETTRATLGTIDYLNRMKKEARLKQLKVEKQEEHVVAASDKDASDNDISHDEIDKMKVDELRKALVTDCAINTM